ncbi:MAG TPA: chaperone NapD [Desulfomonilaceae bacterium]|nr:chaperone NapD [Desulfomonilaceae bacterium]
MVITGSALFIEPGTTEQVTQKLREYPEITIQTTAPSGTELVVNMEAENHGALEDLCNSLKEHIPEIIDVAHIYIHFEEEVEKMVSGGSDDGQ